MMNERLGDAAAADLRSVLSRFWRIKLHYIRLQDWSIVLERVVVR